MYAIVMILIVTAQVLIARTKSFAANIAFPIAMLIAVLLYIIL
jgi:hypothetical protein